MEASEERKPVRVKFKSDKFSEFIKNNKDKGLFVFTGKNGIGKTTFLKNLQSDLKNEFDINYIESDSTFPNSGFENIGLSYSDQYYKRVNQVLNNIKLNSILQNSTDEYKVLQKIKKLYIGEELIKKSDEELIEIINHEFFIYNLNKIDVETPVDFLKRIAAYHGSLAAAYKDYIDLRKEINLLHKFYLNTTENAEHQELKNFIKYIQNDDDYQNLLKEYVKDKSQIKESEDLINKYLNSIGYKYNISLEFCDNDFRTKIVFRKGNIAVQNINLSSGETFILGAVMWQFRFENFFKDKDSNNKIKLMLLDEPDRHLDPMLCKKFINIVEKVFIKNGIKVVMSTHRIDTLALVPEGSIFTLKQNEQLPRTFSIEQIHRIEALAELSINLSSFTGFQVKVYVEALDDRVFYELIYENLLKYTKYIKQQKADEMCKELIDIANLSEKFKMHFYPASTEKDTSGGWTAVEKMVKHGGDICKVITNLGSYEHYKNINSPMYNLFRSYNVDNPFGVVDMDDGNHNLVERITVIKRYSVENFMCDPVLLVVVLEEYLQTENIQPEYSLIKEYVENLYNSLLEEEKLVDRINQQLKNLFEFIEGYFDKYKQKVLNEFIKNELDRFYNGFEHAKLLSLQIIKKKEKKESGSEDYGESSLFDNDTSTKSSDDSSGEEETTDVGVEQENDDGIGVKTELTNTFITDYKDKKDFNDLIKQKFLQQIKENSELGTYRYDISQAKNEINTYCFLLKLSDSIKKFLKLEESISSLNSDQSVKVLFENCEILDLNYPTWFIEARGHDIYDLFKCFFGDFKNYLFTKLHEQILSQDSNSLIPIPCDLIDVFTGCNQKILEQIYNVTRPGEGSPSWPDTEESVLELGSGVLEL